MPSTHSVETVAPRGAAAGRQPIAATRAILGDVCELWTLFAFAVAQPIYSRLVHRPMYLERQVDSSLWLLMALLSVAVPLVLAAVSVGLGRVSRRAYGLWHAAAWRLLAGLLVLLSIRHVLPKVPYLLAAIAVVGATALLVTLRRRVAATGSLLRLTAAGTLIFPAAFGLEVFRDHGDPRSAAASVPIRHPVPVVVVVFDEFCGVTLMDANREINAERFPGFAALARQATWYRNATSTHPRTDRAIPALLSGRFPDREVQPLSHEYPQNLFSLLLTGPTYVPVVMEPYTRLYPREQMMRLPVETRYRDTAADLLQTLGLAYLQEILPEDQPLMVINLPLVWFNLQDHHEEWEKRSGLIRHFWDRNRSRQVDQFLDCIVSRPQPALYFAHLCLPHFPWCFLPSGRRYGVDDGLFVMPPTPGAYGEFQEDWGPDELATDQACARYILQTQFADRQITRLLARLQETGLFDECLLIVAADHGVSFRPNHSRRTAAADSLADIMSIPLFVKLPHQVAGSTSDRNVETIDVLPTIADVLGIDLPQATDGVSFLDPSAPEKSVKRFVNEGEVLEVDAVFEEKYAVQAHLLGKFGGGRSPERLYRLGPRSELIGRPAEELRDQLHPLRSGVIDDPRTFRAEDDFVPCFLTGHVTGDTEPERPVAVAIAVNGVIRGTTRTYVSAKLRDRWSVLLPEEAFEPGENQVEVYVLADTGGEAKPE